MNDLWFTADTHFNHANILTYCARPFADLHEMNEALVASWNSIVRPEDVVVHVGDVFMGLPEDAAPLLARLHGRKVLLTGNHDAPKNRLALLRAFGWKMFQSLGFGEVFIRHKPVSEEAMRELGYAHVIHGHAHGTCMNKGHFDMGVDVDWKRGGRPYPPPHVLDDATIDALISIGCNKAQEP